MPVALRWAFAASLLIHAAALFWSDGRQTVESPPSILTAELRPMPKAEVPAVETVARQATEQPKPTPRRAERRPQTVPKPVKTPPATPPEAEPPIATAVAEAPAAEQESVAASDVPGEVVPVATPESIVPEAANEAAIRDFPSQGRIVYRVDRGDAGFQIGISRQEWQVADGTYRLHSVSETVGLAWLVRSVKQEADSRGKMTARGFVPESYAVLRNGRETSEKALFDWENQIVDVGRRRASLDAGAQDFLSFAYQLGFADPSASGMSMPIATGKKYGVYRLENLGDEEITIPLGKMRTAHFRAAGIDAELWLAYEYSLLPVKIRFIDNKGDTYVQVATTIELGQP